MRYASTAVPTSASATAAPRARSTPVHVRASRRAASAWAETTRAYVASISRSSVSSTRSPRTRLRGSCSARSRAGGGCCSEVTSPR